MGGEATKAISKEVLWGGGRSPFSVSYGKMMMWYFLVSDALTFGGLLTAYGFARAGSTEAWPIGEQVFRALPGVEGEYPLMYVALMTFILIISSVTMVLAVEAGHRNDKRGVINWLAATVVGGLIFLGSQAWEWSHFIHGSGGAFLTAQEVTVNDESGNAIVVPAGTPVYMDHHFGDMAEKWLEGSHDVSLSEHNGTVHFTENGAHGSHEAALHEVRINKYVENETKILDAEATKLWNARSPNFTFGANLHDSEYAVQQNHGFPRVPRFLRGGHQPHRVADGHQRGLRTAQALRDGGKGGALLALCRPRMGLRIYVLLPHLIDYRDGKR